MAPKKQPDAAAPAVNNHETETVTIANGGDKGTSASNDAATQTGNAGTVNTEASTGSAASMTSSETGTAAAATTAKTIEGGETSTASVAGSQSANIAAATEFDPSGAPVQIVSDVDPSHPAVDNNPRANTTVDQNRIDFNDPTISGAEAVAQSLAKQQAAKE